MTNLIFDVYNWQHAQWLFCVHAAKLYNNVSWSHALVFAQKGQWHNGKYRDKQRMINPSCPSHCEAWGLSKSNSNEHENRHSCCVSLLTLSMPLSYKANQSLWTERLTEVNSSRHRNNCWKISHLNVNNTMLEYRVLFRF